MKKTNLKETLKQIVGVLLFGYVCIAEAVSTGCKKLRTLPKKVMAVCIAAALIVAMVPTYVFAAETTYDIWVGGVQVTSANKDNIVVPGAIGSATYDPDTQTLTLNNFSYTGLGYNHYYYYDEDYGEHYYSYAAIYSKNKLIIKLVGNNTVFCEGEGAGLPYFCGVYTEEYGDLTICDDTTDNAIGSFSANRISSYGNLTIRDVNMTAQYRLNALYSAGDLWIQNATVMATAEFDAITCYGDITMEDSIVTATSTNTGECGIFHRDTLTVKNSIVEMIGGKASESLSASTLIPTLEFDIPFVVLAGADKASAVTADSSVDATYTGKYVKITPIYKVTFDYGSFGNETVTVIHGECVEPATPVFAGKVLIGWYTVDGAGEPNEFDFTNPITENITVYAKFADYEGDKEALQDAIDALEADVAQLNKLTENGGAIDQINAKISAIESQIAVLDELKNKYAEADTALKQELQAADAAINAAIAALTTRVQDLEADLAAAKSDISTNTSKVAQLTTNLAALNASLTDLSNKLTNDYATKAELTSAINSAKDTINSAIAALTVRVQDLEAGLAAVNSKVDTNTSDVTALKSDVDTLNTWKNEAQSAITALQTLTGTQGTDIANLKLAVQSLEAELAAANARIDDAEDRIAALEGKVFALEIAKQNLDAAVAALNAAINNKADTATLNQKVTDLIAAIAAAEDAAKTYADGKDTALQTQLTAAIATAKGEAITAAENLVNTAKAQLQAAIDNKADTATVNAAIANLQNAITALQNAKDNYIAADATLKAELEEKIAKAKQEAIDAAKGHIPYIGTNGNWWIGDTDTGVDANGIKGDTGNGIASITTKKENGVTTVTITFTDPEKEPVVFTISDGETGATGADGVGIAKIEKTATNGNVDTYTITLTNGKTYTFTVTNGKDGANGKDGENGKDGADGKDGLTPFIGENGNWWIGETDTGVKAAADDSIPVGSGNVTEAEGVNTVTVVAIVIASLALLGNVLLAVLVLKKKKSLV